MLFDVAWKQLLNGTGSGRLPWGCIEQPEPLALKLGEINRFQGWALLPRRRGWRSIFSDDFQRPKTVKIYHGDERIGSCQCGFKRKDLRRLLGRRRSLIAGFEGNIFIPKQINASLRLVAFDAFGVSYPLGELSLPDCFYNLETAPGSADIRGWAFSPLLEIKEIEVCAGGQVIGVCEYGITRRDVHAEFPGWKRARKSGFEGKLSAPAADDWKLIARDAEGNALELR